jgi:hypothetical protein
VLHDKGENKLCLHVLNAPLLVEALEIGERLVVLEQALHSQVDILIEFKANFSDSYKEVWTASHTESKVFNLLEV